MTNTNGPIIDFDCIAWESPNPGVRSKCIQKDGQRLRLVEFTREFVEHDWCQKGHVGFLLEGELEVDFSSRIERVRAGNGLFIPEGAQFKHKARVISERALLVLVERA